MTKVWQASRAGAALREAIHEATTGPGAVDGLPCWYEADDWFSDSPVLQRGARLACGRCPVRVECLTAAQERGERHGTWGGVTFT